MIEKNRNYVFRYIKLAYYYKYYAKINITYVITINDYAYKLKALNW